jgi:hypothetical protein
MIEQLPETVKTDAIPLNVEPMDIQEEFIYADRMMIYQDSILIVTNVENKNTVPSVQLYNLNQDKIIGGFAHYGNGPGEVLGIFTYLNGNILQINDYVKRQFAIVDLNKHPAVPRDVDVMKILNPFEILNYTKYDDNTMVVVNHYYFEDKKTGIDNEQSHRLYMVPLRQLTEGRITFDEEHKYDTMNVTQGALITNNDKGRIVFASFHKGLEVYDGDLNLIKTITGPDEFDVNYSVKNYGGSPEVIFGKDSPNTYKQDFYATNDYFLVLYIGSPDYRAVPQYVFKFDWDGNFLESYRVDSRIATISVSSDGETMYAMTYDEEGLPIMVKLVK